MRAHNFLQLPYSFYCSDSEQKMEGELASLMEVYHLMKNAVRSATPCSMDQCLVSPVLCLLCPRLPSASPPVSGACFFRMYFKNLVIRDNPQ